MQPNGASILPERVNGDEMTNPEFDAFCESVQETVRRQLARNPEVTWSEAARARVCPEQMADDLLHLDLDTQVNQACAHMKSRIASGFVLVPSTGPAQAILANRLLRACRDWKKADPMQVFCGRDTTDDYDRVLEAISSKLRLAAGDRNERCIAERISEILSRRSVVMYVRSLDKLQLSDRQRFLNSFWRLCVERAEVRGYTRNPGQLLLITSTDSDPSSLGIYGVYSELFGVCGEQAAKAPYIEVLPPIRFAVGDYRKWINERCGGALGDVSLEAALDVCQRLDPAEVYEYFCQSAGLTWATKVVSRFWPLEVQVS